MERKARILIVDDQPEMLRIMHRMLRDDFDVVTTHLAQTVPKLVRTEGFAVVIVDLVMPILSGLDILGEVKRISPATEVVIVTGHATVRTTKQALRSGAYDYLERPFAKAELQHVVRNAIIDHEMNAADAPEPDAEVSDDPRPQEHLQLLGRIQELEAKLEQAEERTFQNTVELLYQLIGVRQHDTMLHLRSVEDYALPVGERLGLSERQKMDLQIAAAFHDIGKLAVDERILYKPGPLTETEWKQMQTHPRIGARIVGAVAEWQGAAMGILHHQEQMDGKGYPEGLKGQEIPLIARIIAVVDAYDAMTSKRAYKKAMSRQEAIDELNRSKGAQFDAEVVDAFTACLLGVSMGSSPTPRKTPQQRH